MSETLDTPTDTTPITTPAPVAAAPAPVAPVAPVVPAAPAAPPAEPEDKGYWPADWREKASKGDSKRSNILSRFGSPEAALDALIEVRDRFAKGELKQALKKDATAEEVAAWRSEAGIPESPDKYDVGSLTDTQKEAFNVLFRHAHATNQTPDQVKATAAAWSEIVRMESEKRSENDVAVSKAAEDALREEWGPEYRRNVNVIDNMLNTVANESLKDLIFEARAKDGSQLGSKPEVMRAMLALALIQNPAGVVVPGSEANPMKGLETRIAEIELLMRTNRKAYNDPKISGPDGEYGKLLAAREKLKG